MTKAEFESILYGYMLDYGIDNVRGGPYQDLVFEREDKLLVKMKIARQFDKCFNCLADHRVKRCEETIEGKFFIKFVFDLNFVSKKT